MLGREIRPSNALSKRINGENRDGTSARNWYRAVNQQLCTPQDWIVGIIYPQTARQDGRLVQLLADVVDALGDQVARELALGLGAENFLRSGNGGLGSRAANFGGRLRF